MSKTLEQLSQLYSERATLLTEGIERAEARLMALPGRVRTITEMGDGGRLVWDRHEGAWRILYGFSDVEGPLASCGVEQKAQCAKFLSCLYEDIAIGLQKKIDTVDTGLGALQQFFNPTEATP